MKEESYFLPQKKNMDDLLVGYKPNSILDFIRISSKYLQSKGIDSARLDAELLLCRVLKTSRINLYINSDKPISNREKSDYRTLIQRRAKREPVAYITGHKEFYGFDFKVTGSVLIPRPETETLVEWVLKWADRSFLSWKKIKVADIGTGSGCIAAAIMLELGVPLNFTLSDISHKALEIARENLTSFNLYPNPCISMRQGFLFEVLEKNRYHLIISNPPYIAEQKIKTLAPEIMNFEPQEALLGGIDGMELQMKLIKHGRIFLEEGGVMVLEIGEEQGGELTSFAKKYNWKQTDILPDLNGDERILVLYK